MEVVNTVGRRKAAVARVYVKPGKGQITINRKALEVYFPLEILQYQVKQPLLATNTAENYDIVINLDGGGITGQASVKNLEGINSWKNIIVIFNANKEARTVAIPSSTTSARSTVPHA